MLRGMRQQEQAIILVSITLEKVRQPQRAMLLRGWGAQGSPGWGWGRLVEETQMLNLRVWGASRGTALLTDSRGVPMMWLHCRPLWEEQGLSGLKPAALLPVPLSRTRSWSR